MKPVTSVDTTRGHTNGRIEGVSLANRVKISFPPVGNELDLIWHTSARRATRAAQRREKALEASEPRSSNLRGYTDPVRSAKLPTGVNKILMRFALSRPSGQQPRDCHQNEPPHGPQPSAVAGHD